MRGTIQNIREIEKSIKHALRILPTEDTISNNEQKDRIEKLCAWLTLCNKEFGKDSNPYINPILLSINSLARFFIAAKSEIKNTDTQDTGNYIKKYMELLIKEIQHEEELLGGTGAEGATTMQLSGMISKCPLVESLTGGTPPNVEGRQP